MYPKGCQLCRIDSAARTNTCEKDISWGRCSTPWDPDAGSVRPLFLPRRTHPFYSLSLCAKKANAFYPAPLSEQSPLYLASRAEKNGKWSVSKGCPPGERRHVEGCFWRSAAHPQDLGQTGKSICNPYVANTTLDSRHLSSGCRRHKLFPHTGPGGHTSLGTARSLDPETSGRRNVPVTMESRRLFGQAQCPYFSDAKERPGCRVSITQQPGFRQPDVQERSTIATTSSFLSR